MWEDKEVNRFGGGIWRMCFEQEIFKLEARCCGLMCILGEFFSIFGTSVLPFRNRRLDRKIHLPHTALRGKGNSGTVPNFAAESGGIIGTNELTLGVQCLAGLYL